jgi:hypothetical protein
MIAFDFASFENIEVFNIVKEDKSSGSSTEVLNKFTAFLALT